MKRRFFSTLAAAIAVATLPYLAQAQQMLMPAIPSEIYVPQGAQPAGYKQEADGDFSVKYRLPSGNVQALAQQAREHAEKQGYRVFKSQDKGHEVEVNLVRGNTEMEISVEREWNGIDYEVELEQHGVLQ